jgi:Tfp pilus assembly protein PilN
VKRLRIELDFAARRRRAPRLGLLCLFAGGLLVALAAVRITDALAARAASRAALTELEAEAASRARPTARAPAAVDGRIKARSAASQQIAQALQSPWAELLEVIALKPEGDVALLSVEPSAVKRTVRITAESRSEAAMLEHLSLLQQDRRLSDVMLTTHQHQTQMPGSPWRYQIQGSW